MLESDCSGNINAVAEKDVKGPVKNILKSNDMEHITHILLSKNMKDMESAAEYMKTFDFEGMEFLDALKLFNSRVVISGDSNEVSTIVNHFCIRYCDFYKGPYTSSQFSSIMASILFINKAFNHNNGRDAAPLDVFLSCFQERNDIDKDYLTNIYYSLKANPILRLNMNTKHDLSTSKKRVNMDANESEAEIKKIKDEIEPEQHFGAGFVSRKIIKSPKLKASRISVIAVVDKLCTWKPFYASLDDLTLTLYNDVDIRQYVRQYAARLSKLSYLMKDPEFAMFLREQKPIEKMALDHCLAKPIIEQSCKFKLYLLDKSEYCFKVPQPLDVEFWYSTINYAAGLQSVPNFGGLHHDLLAHSVPRFNRGFTNLSILDQIKRHHDQLAATKAQMKHIENLKVKPDKYKKKLKKAQFQIQRFESYIRCMAIEHQHPRSNFSSHSHDPRVDVDSLVTYHSDVCGVSEEGTSSRSSVVFESRSSKYELGVSGVESEECSDEVEDL